LNILYLYTVYFYIVLEWGEISVTILAVLFWSTSTSIRAVLIQADADRKGGLQTDTSYLKVQRI